MRNIGDSILVKQESRIEYNDDGVKRIVKYDPFAGQDLYEGLYKPAHITGMVKKALGTYCVWLYEVRESLKSKPFLVSEEDIAENYD